METVAENIPQDVISLQELIVQLKNKNESLLQEVNYLSTKLEQLHFQLLNSLRRQYARKSEKLDGQLELQFDEATDENQEEVTQADEEITIAKHTRKKTGRRPLPEAFHREQIIHDLLEEQKICSCGHALHKMGEERSEQLEFIPARIKVLEHIRFKYACRLCAEGVKTALLPPQAIPKSISTPGLLSHVLTSKFEDHLPLYRQEQIWQRLGIDIPRATLCNWVLKCGELFAPLIKLLKAEIIESTYIHADETPVQVLKEEGKSATSKSYIWVYLTGPPAKPLVIYEYQPTRKGQVAYDFLEDFKGYLQTDAYPGYNALRKRDDINVFACWAHSRRKFVEIVKATKDNGKAQIALNFIRKLYEVESQVKAQNFNELYKLRQERSKPILERFKIWLDEHVTRIPPKSPLGGAIAYTLSNWDALNVYLTNGHLRIDNNHCENKIRPFALGRRNWLFMGNARGANAATAILSLIESAKANGLEAYYYLRYLLTKLPTCQTADQLKALLPHHCNSIEIMKI